MADTPPQLNILFVCTGNICRSPTAHGVMAHLAAQERIAVGCDSCGITAHHAGEPPDPRSIRAAAARGIDIAPLRARPFAPDDLDRFSLILAMDRTHYEFLAARAGNGESARKIGLFRQVAGIGGHDVPDPWYGLPGGDQKGFELVFDLIENGCRSILTKIRNGQLT